MALEKPFLKQAIAFLAVFFYCILSAFSQTLLVLGDDLGEIKTAGLYDCIPCGFDSKNYEDHPDFLATTWTKNGNKSVGRSLIKFDLSQIPAGATIISAKLDLYHYDSPFNSGHSQLSGTNSSKLFKVTQPWLPSTVTWNNKPNFTTASAISLAATTNDSVDVLNIDLMQFVPNWYAQPSSNHGLVFIIDTEIQYRAMLFGSAENPDPSVRPRLVIEYKTDQPDPPDSLHIKIPNVFTPNNDGTSDFFEVEMLNFNAYKIQIFNRWGSLVFESDDVSTSWDGTFKGNEVAEGVYFAIISALDLFGQKHEKHTTVTLFR